MRIAFAGKGGAGKTTLCALLARGASARGLPVRALDADSNQHLALALGLAEEEARALPAVGHELETVIGRLCASTMRDRAGSRVLDDYEQEMDGIRLAVAGSPSLDAVGTSECFRGDTVAELFLSHRGTRDDEIALVDLAAGTAPLASDVFTLFDLTFLVCEPTPSSVDVWRSWRALTERHGVRLRVLGNKVRSRYDVRFLREEVGDDLLACFADSDGLGALEFGRRPEPGALEFGNQEALATVLRELDGSGLDLARWSSGEPGLPDRAALGCCL